MIKYIMYGKFSLEKGVVYMRSCIYCGRDLGKDEKCMCARAVAARQAKESNSEKNYESGQDSTYRTGYTGTDKKKFRFKKLHFKKPKFKKPDFKSTANIVSGFTKRFMYDPINGVSNPDRINSGQVFLVLILTALFLSLCGFFVSSRLLSGLMYEAGLSIKYNLRTLLVYTGIGTVVMTVIELVFVSVLYFINRFVLKYKTKFSLFIIRPVAALIPVTVFSLLGALISFFSVYATVMLVFTGSIMNIILTYEGMRSEWSSIPATRTMYLTAFAYFLFFVVVFNIIRIF